MKNFILPGGHVAVSTAQFAGAFADEQKDCVLIYRNMEFYRPTGN